MWIAENFAVYTLEVITARETLKMVAKLVVWQLWTVWAQAEPPETTELHFKKNRKNRLINECFKESMINDRSSDLKLTTVAAPVIKKKD